MNKIFSNREGYSSSAPSGTTPGIVTFDADYSNQMSPPCTMSSCRRMRIKELRPTCKSVNFAIKQTLGIIFKWILSLLQRFLPLNSNRQPTGKNLYQMLALIASYGEETGSANLTLRGGKPWSLMRAVNHYMCRRSARLNRKT